MKHLTYQFSNVSDVWILDPAALRPIRFLAGGVRAEMFPPVSDSAMVPFPTSLAGQPISATVGLIKISVSLNDSESGPEWRTLYDSVIQCLSWIRAATRQYWVGTLPSHQANAPTALLLTEEDGKQESISRLGAVHPGIRWVPLDLETWEAIEQALSKAWWPSVSEQFLMDSSLHIAEGNLLQGVAGVGIACEIELNNLIDDLLIRINQEAITKLYKKGRPEFSWKLEHLPQLLGVQAFKPSNPDHVAALKEMYGSRGSIVHRGHAQMSGQQIARYWFATEAFFQWSRRERMRLGISPDMSRMYKGLDQGMHKFTFVTGAS